MSIAAPTTEPKTTGQVLSEHASLAIPSVEAHRRLADTWLGRNWKIPVVVIMLVVAVFSLRGHLPSLSAIGHALGAADPRWIVTAGAFEAISLAMFARQQRSLLLALAVRMSVPRALAVTYARSAIAISMPAGSAVSAGFAFQQYKRSGASNEKATAVMVLSGLISILGLAALYVSGLLGVLVSAPTTTWRAHPVAVSAGAAAAVLAAVGYAVTRRIRSARSARPAQSIADPDSLIGRGRTGLRQAGAAWRHLRPRHWLIAGGFAVLNWLTDLLCLASAARAFHLPVGIGTIASIYLGVQLVRQIPLTPGGIGLIETGLLAGLVHAGSPTAAAAAVVLTYRVLSCWLIIPIGGLAWLGLRSRPPDTVPQSG